jgi:hypothetical protein
MVFVYFTRHSDGFEAAITVVSRHQKRRCIGFFGGELCEESLFAKHEVRANVSNMSKEVHTPQPVKNRPNRAVFALPESWILHGTGSTLLVGKCKAFSSENSTEIK